MTPDDVRSVALGLEGAVEAPHHGFPSFRTKKRIFATLPDDEHVNVMLDEGDIRAAVAEWPDFCAEQWWGKTLAAVRVTLSAADSDIVAELVQDAWRRYS